MRNAGDESRGICWISDSCSIGIKYHDQKQFKEKRVYFFLHFQKDRVHHRMVWQQARLEMAEEQEVDRTHFHPHIGSRERNRK